MKSRLLLPPILWLSVVLAGCTSFESDWKATTRHPTPTNDISGPWIGTWQNTNNAHGDQLRAVVKRVGLHAWKAHFHAHYGRLLTFSYEARLTGDEHEGRVQFTGEQNLGWLAGGTFRYVGEASPTNFFSTYENAYDSGTFTLHRP
jgi:hypothetical protein